jgi:hypothetical protein
MFSENVLAGLAVLLSLLLSACIDVDTAKDCEEELIPEVLRKTKEFPSDSVLRAHGARIEHVLKGSEEQVRALANLVAPLGWQVSVEPVSEFGWAVKISEDPARFRVSPSNRIRAICALAESRDLNYTSWWLVAGKLTIYVSRK